MLIRGDNDIDLPFEKELLMNIHGRSFKFLHGYQFNIGGERATGRIVSALKKVHEKLPVVAYAIFSKARSRTNGYLILGHSTRLGVLPEIGGGMLRFSDDGEEYLQ